MKTDLQIFHFVSHPSNCEVIWNITFWIVETSCCFLRFPLFLPIFLPTPPLRFFYYLYISFPSSSSPLLIYFSTKSVLYSSRYPQFKARETKRYRRFTVLSGISILFLHLFLHFSFLHLSLGFSIFFIIFLLRPFSPSISFLFMSVYFSKFTERNLHSPGFRFFISTSDLIMQGIRSLSISFYSSIFLQILSVHVAETCFVKGGWKPNSEDESDVFIYCVGHPGCTRLPSEICLANFSFHTSVVHTLEHYSLLFLRWWLDMSVEILFLPAQTAYDRDKVCR